MRKLRASIVMPVYNSAAYVGAAIDSILNQTYSDFEFLIFDDGSTDNSLDVIKSRKDPRIRLFTSRKNVGYVKHLNRGFKLAGGEYFIRMDADDIAFPRRLERQIEFMDNNPQLGLCGSWACNFGSKNGFVKPPLTHEKIILQLLNGTTIIHPTAIIRSSVLKNNNLFYREDYLYTEEYELWVRLSKVTRLANIPEVLLFYRIHDKSVSALKSKKQMELVNKIRVSQFEDLLGKRLDDFELDFATFNIDFSKLNINKLRDLVHRIKTINSKCKLYHPKELDKYLIKRISYNLIVNRINSPAFFFKTLLIMLSFPSLFTILAAFAYAKIQKWIPALKKPGNDEAILKALPPHSF